MNFVSIDFETADYSRKSACSVGLVKYLDGKKVDTFYSLIRPPELYIRPDFTAIHGLTVEDVKDAPTFAELWGSKICPFIGDLPLVAHNANFDMGVLLAVHEWYKIKLISDLRYFCSCKLAKSTWPSLKSHALSALAKEFKIEYEAHNALDDAETCGKIVLMAAEKYNSSSLKELLMAVNTTMKIILPNWMNEMISEAMESNESYEFTSADLSEDCVGDLGEA